MKLHSSLEDLISEFVSGTPDRALFGIAADLRAGKIDLSSSSVGIGRADGVNTEMATRAAALFANLGDQITPDVLAGMFIVAGKVRSTERINAPSVQIVWTGPEASGPLVRPTVTVLDEMLAKIRDSGEVLLVGYALSAPVGSAMSTVINRLEDATKRGARITLILHSDDQETNLSNLMAIWNVFTKKPKVYTWNPSADHPYTSLHAKCLVVDRLDALVTSANFTFHGLESNLEVGLRVLGPQAAAIFERFDHLIAAGILTRV